MKGVVFTIFEDFVTENWGVETFESLLEACPEAAAEPFIGPKTYPDEWIVQLLTAACDALKIEPADALRAFGKFCFGGLISRYPNFVEGITHPRELIVSVHDIIHVEVKKLMEGATPPNLICEDKDAEELVVAYDSERGLCALMEGLLDGAAEHFNVPIEYEQVTCTHRGDEQCTFKMRFLEPAVN